MENRCNSLSCMTLYPQLYFFICNKFHSFITTPFLRFCRPLICTNARAQKKRGCMGSPQAVQSEAVIGANQRWWAGNSEMSFFRQIEWLSNIVRRSFEFRPKYSKWRETSRLEVGAKFTPRFQNKARLKDPHTFGCIWITTVGRREEGDNAKLRITSPSWRYVITWLTIPE